MAVWIGAWVFCRSMEASVGANCLVPVSTSTMPSSVSKAVTPENCDWNQVRSAAITGPPVQKNLASSGVLPRIWANFAAGFCAMVEAPSCACAAMLTPWALPSAREKHVHPPHHSAEAARRPSRAGRRTLDLLQRDRHGSSDQGAGAGHPG